jgi:hydroxymethylglutaryl-CoA lyase
MQEIGSNFVEPSHVESGHVEPGHVEPGHVQLCDVGPRDGFQFEQKQIPTELKLSTIRSLIDAGMPRVQVTSFVHPTRVPQMADAESIVAQLADVKTCVLSGLALNVRGVKRAAESGLKAVDLSIATNERHGLDNANMTVDEGVAAAAAMIDEARALGLSVQLNLQTVWGYKQPNDTDLERILGITRMFAQTGLESFSLADSTGMANPNSIQSTVKAVQAETDTPIVLHLHDTRGLGMANIVAALAQGVRRFDTSLGGLGGCPFIPGATGNVATEDVVYLLEQLGYKSGIQNATVASASKKMAAFLGRHLSGKMYTLL